MLLLVLCVLFLSSTTLSFVHKVASLRSNNTARGAFLLDYLLPPKETGIPIIDAVNSRSSATVAAVLARGDARKTVNERDAEGNNALHLIAKRGHYKFPPEAKDSVPNLLLNAGIEINAKTQKTNKTALEIALLSGWQRIAMLLLDKGADRSVVTSAVKSAITCPGNDL